MSCIREAALLSLWVVVGAMEVTNLVTNVMIARLRRRAGNAGGADVPATARELLLHRLALCTATAAVCRRGDSCRASAVFCCHVAGPSRALR